MAIAGSGGWVPSCTIIVRAGGLVTQGMVSNKPADTVYSDIEKSARGNLADAVELLKQDIPICVDMTHGQFMKLVALWAKSSNQQSQN